LTPERWITFDCFGTLVDWRSGFSAILAPLVGSDCARLLRAYHEIEPLIQAERPFRPYKEVLAVGLIRAAGKTGISLSETKARSLERSWGSLPVFGDVEEMLAGLRALGFRLGVLTNCDEDLFEQTHLFFRQRFDLVVTAERVRDYKPSLSHFRHFAQLSGAKNNDWIHVACSMYHDIEPARQLGITRIWLDRENTREDATMATARVQSAAQVCDFVKNLTG